MRPWKAGQGDSVVDAAYDEFAAFEKWAGERLSRFDSDEELCTWFEDAGFTERASLYAFCCDCADAADDDLSRRKLELFTELVELVDFLQMALSIAENEGYSDDEREKHNRATALLARVAALGSK